MIDVEWRENDMREGLKIIHKNPFTTELDLDWSDVDAIISLCIAYRELKGSKERVGVFSTERTDEPQSVNDLLNMDRIPNPNKEGSI
tara:strand:+ start:361 stop:621 length:261 start_codon:yes stop_codon:yes gene_type:complete